MAMTYDHKGIVEEIKSLVPDVDADEFLAIPEVLELEIMARHRQTLRNTAVLNRNTSAIARVSGRTDESRKLGQQMNNLVKDMVELDRRFPEAKAKMLEMDAEAAKNRQEAKEA